MNVFIENPLLSETREASQGHEDEGDDIMSPKWVRAD